MTVLVGVLCSDGVVVGSDSSATFSSVNMSTIEQPIQKLFTVGNDLVFAITGAGGLGQRLEATITRLKPNPMPGKKWEEMKGLDIACLISQQMIANMRLTYLDPGGFGALLALKQAYPPGFRRPHARKGLKYPRIFEEMAHWTR